MRQVTIALAQMNPVMDDVSRNLDTMVKLVEDVSLQHKIDLFVFPELATTGYECGVRFADLAERVTDHTVNTLASAPRSTIPTSCSAWPRSKRWRA
jgi:predicted amidohydrolase